MANWMRLWQVMLRGMLWNRLVVDMRELVCRPFTVFYGRTCLLHVGEVVSKVMKMKLGS